MQDSPFNTIEVLWERTSKYLETKIQLVKLQAIEKAASLISAILSQVILLITLLFFLFFLNVGIAIWIGILLGKLYAGFFILSAFYLLTGILVLIFRKKLIQKPINHFLIKEILK